MDLVDARRDLAADIVPTGSVASGTASTAMVRVALAGIVMTPVPAWLRIVKGKAIGLGPATCRTLAFEVGMQNLGLAATLARSYICPVAALPGAVFLVWHNLFESLLADIQNQDTIGIAYRTIKNGLFHLLAAARYRASTK